MELADVFETIAPSIVALGSRITRKDSPAPNILGTGFVVDRRGLVLTAGHVARTLHELPRHPETSQHAAFALPYQPPIIRDDNGTLEQANAYVPIHQIFPLTQYGPLPGEPSGRRYGESLPDFAFLQLSVSDVPSVEIDDGPNVIRSGVPIAYAGYPLGGAGLTLRLEEPATQVQTIAVSSTRNCVERPPLPLRPPERVHHRRAITGRRQRIPDLHSEPPGSRRHGLRGCRRNEHHARVARLTSETGALRLAEIGRPSRSCSTGHAVEMALPKKSVLHK